MNRIDEGCKLAHGGPKRRGFSLLEVMVALALFGLIAVAGLSMLNAILDGQIRTETRIRRLSDIQRALFVVTTDLDQISGRIEGDDSEIAFQKTDANGRPTVVRYRFSQNTLVRRISAARGERDQILLRDVDRLSWRYRLPEAGWVQRVGPEAYTAQPPTSIAPSELEPSPQGVIGVSLDLDLIGPDGRSVGVRRVIVTPEISS